MKKYILTSKRFVGQIVLIYNERGTLSYIDMLNADLDAETTTSFVRTVPVVESMLPTAYSSDTTIVQGDFKVSFEEFWNRYDNKVNRKRCLPIWEKMSLTQQVKAFYGIKEYDKFLKAKNRIKCDPENYLRNEMYENEYKY